MGWILASAWLACVPIHAQTFVDPRFSSELVASLPSYQAVEVAWSPDGDMYILQRNGIVRVHADGQLLQTPFIDFSAKVNTFSDRGMLGMALHPDFDQNGYVYLAYVHEPAGATNDAGPKLSRLVRVTANPSNPHVAIANSEVILLGNLPAESGAHTVGALRFATDGRLFFGNGDASNPSRYASGVLRALSLDSYAGKLLRLADDGTAPGDNPFDDGTNSVRSRVWAYGLRNPFRFALHPTTGAPFIGDVGWDTIEEINHGPAGSHFGWPCYEGIDPQQFHSVDYAEACSLYPPASVTPPVFSYSHGDLPPVPGAIVAGDSVTGGSFYTGSVYPAIYAGNYFFTDYVAGWVLRMVVESDGTVTDVLPFATGLDSPVALAMGPDDLLYSVSFVSGDVRRIRYLGPVAVASAAPTSGYSPLPVTFSSAGSSDSQGGSLAYAWDFGDGSTSTLANPVHAFVSATVQTYTTRLTVTNPSNMSAADEVAVTINSTPPTAQVSAPPDGVGVLPGQTVTFQGSAVDPDEGSLQPGQLHWTILLHHDTHVHTVLSTTGTGGALRASYHGTGTYAYEVQLRAEDASGLSDLASVNVPVLPDTTPPSAPGSLSAVAIGPGRLDLSWVPATDLAGISGYRVERCPGTTCVNFAQIATPQTAGFADTGLAPTTTYRYRVRAVDQPGNAGPYSAVAQATTPSGSQPIGLVAAYDLNAGSGSVARDVTSNANDGSISGATWTVSGRFGGALDFDGIDDRVGIPPAPGLDFTLGTTLEAWVYPSQSSSGWATIIQHAVDDYFLHASRPGAALQPVGGILSSAGVEWVGASSAIPVGAWTHLASTYDGAAIRLYVNGGLAGTVNRSGGIQTTPNSVYFGGNVPYGEFFRGRIDEIRLYNRALAVSEIQADMNAPVVVEPVGPPAVPSGIAGLGMTVSKNDPAANSLDVSWDDSCAGAAEHHIVYGGRSQLPSVAGGIFGVSGAVCSAASPFTWNSPATTIDPSGLVWWIVVASTGSATEGAWGVDSAGVERNGPGAGGSSGLCGTEGKSLSNSCGR